MTTQSALLSSLILATLLASFNSIAACSSQASQTMNQKDYLNLIKPGETSGDVGFAKIYAREEKCHILTGCGNLQDADHKLKSGSYMGYKNAKTYPLVSNNVEVKVKAKANNLYLEMFFDTHSFSYQIGGRGNAKRKVNVSPVKGSALIDKNKKTIKFDSFRGERKSRFGTEGTAYSLFVGKGSTKPHKISRQNYVRVSPLIGEVYKDGCIFFESFEQTKPDQNGNYSKYITIIAN